MLLYDRQDLPFAQRLRDARLGWLQELGAAELSSVPDDAAGFLFGYQHEEEKYRDLVAHRPNIADRPEHRQELVRLDHVLQMLEQAGVILPTPRTWVLGVDEPLPEDIEFPLFVRTPTSSWKRGGGQGKVRSAAELQDEMELLRRAFGWDTPILARRWIRCAVAGKFMYGEAPQEIRVWIADHRPVAWSFHYLQAVADPQGFPPSASDLRVIMDYARQIGAVFRARLIAADFVRDRGGKWWFLEAGPGAAAGTAHQAVFKYVAERLRGNVVPFEGNAVGGPIT